MKNFRIFSLALFFIMLLTSIAFAIEKPVNTPIDGSTWTPVSLNAGQTCTNYGFQSRSGLAFKVSDSPTGYPYWTVKEDGGLCPGEPIGVPGGLLFYAQLVTAGSETVEVIVKK